MSSDVYIDFFDEAGNEVDTERIGHLGIIHYFGFDLLKSFKRYCNRFELDSKIVFRLKTALKQFNAIQEMDKNLNPEEFSTMYGYAKPDIEEFDDVLTIDDIDAMAVTYKDCTMRIRID